MQGRSARPGSDGQAGTAFGAATFQNQPTAAGCHACAESVGTDALQLAGLVSSFHEENPPDN